MQYFWSLGLLIIGLVLLIPPVVGANRAVGRLRRTRTAVSEHVAERVGLLKARVAGVRVGIARRLHRATE